MVTNSKPLVSPLWLLFLLAALFGCGEEVVESPHARLKSLRFQGRVVSDCTFAGWRMPANSKPVGKTWELAAPIRVPSAKSRIELSLAVRPMTTGYWPGIVRVDIFLSTVSGSRKHVAEFDLEVPQDRTKNNWTPVEFDVPDRWKGEQMQLTIESDYTRLPESAKAHLFVGSPQLRVEGEDDLARRDVVIVTIDTTRADMLTPWGREGAQTPVLDRLADEGTCFLEAFATSNATAPSHASLFTSLHLKDHGVYANDQMLSLDAVTLAESFREYGYETLASVSVRMLAHFSGLSQGFRSMCGPAQGQRGGRLTLADLADVLPERAGPPLFLWVHLFDPHSDDPAVMSYVYNPPKRFAEKFEGADGDRGDLHSEIARYRGEISKTDFLLGKMLEILDERGFNRDRLLVVASDHGEALGELGLEFVHVGLHSSVTRVPLLLHGKGIPAGHQTNSLVSLVDVVPTVLELAGLEPPGTVAGRSLVREIQSVSDEPVFFEEVRGVSIGVRDREWHFVRYEQDVSEGGRSHKAGEEWLFRAAKDERALENLADENPEQVARMRAILEAHLAEPRLGLQASIGEHTDETRAELEAMGYTASDSKKD